MELEKIKSADKFTARCAKIDKIRISVYLVYRGNFNDERLIESCELSVEELKGKPLSWLDLYLGKKQGNRIKIAFAQVSGKNLYFLEDNGEEIKAIKRGEFDTCYTDNGGGKSHIDLWQINRNWMLKAGILPEHITVTDLCTRCHPDLFWSHRKTGNDRGSLAAFIALAD